MRYTVPDYYKKFKCIAGDCPATCCAGWQIVIDDAALKKYKKLAGIKAVKKGIPVIDRKKAEPFGNRLANSIDWEEHTFYQYAGRCAFLNEQNLCDIYTEAGPEYFCKTCRNYPRHIEEFENEREISLSLSCPVVARMLLDRTEKVTFVSHETEAQEEYDDFDEILYFILQDCRSVMLNILQNRKYPVTLRMAMVLGLAHDVQGRIDARQMFDIQNVLNRYQKEGAEDAFQKKLDECMNAWGEEKNCCHKKKLMDLLDELEVLDDSWPEQIRIYRRRLYDFETETSRKLREQAESQMNWTETEAEQLMVYFLFTYFCGAVYDGDVLAKTKMAVVSTLLIQEMELAALIEWETAKGESMNPELMETFGLEERARIAWRFSRELEHSDLNLERMEELMNDSDGTGFETLLQCIMV